MTDKNQILTQALENPAQTLRAMGGLSLYEFMQVFWGEVSQDEFQSNWHIPYLCDHLEKIGKRVGDNLPKEHDLIINVPPGTTKTITCSIMFPAWCWTRWPWMRFITASYSSALSLESAEKSRDLIRSDKFKLMYPDLAIKEDKDTKSNFSIVKKQYVKPGKVPRLITGGNRYSTSVGGSLTGFHGHILIIDDPLNPQQAVSEKELDRTNRWMDQTLPTRKTDKKVSPTVLVMQRLHEDDPTGHLLQKKKEKLFHICIPGEIRNYYKMITPKELADNYSEDGLMDPRRLTWEVLLELESDLGQYGFAGQIGQNPTPPGGGMFKVENLQIVEALTTMANIVKIIRYWDKAGTKGRGAYTAGVKMARTRQGKYIVMDVKRGQWSTEVRERIIRATAEADGRDVEVYIEQEPGSGGKESAEATVKNLAGYACYRDLPTGNKENRADPFSVQVNWGNVLLLRADWNKKFMDELEMFPNGTYKDQVDAGSAGFNILASKKQVRVIR